MAARPTSGRRSLTTVRGSLGREFAGTPWCAADVLRLTTRLGIGLVGLLAAWYGASGSVVFKDQVLWLAGAVLAVVFAGTGATAWLLAALGAVARERRWVCQEVRRTYAMPLSRIAEDSVRFVTGKGMKRYHRPECDVVRGKDVRAVRDREVGVQLLPCGMCLS